MVLSKFKAIIRNLKINKKNIKRLTNENFSLISSNCNGGFILHDLKQRFNSPTVNVFLEAEDYVKFLERFDYYINYKLVEIKTDRYDYPIGALDDVTIHFMHYKSFEEAKKQWKKRLKRINRKNLFIMMTDRDDCNIEIIRRFDNLPFKNKVIFTHKEYANIKSAFYIKGFEQEKQVGQLSNYKSKFSVLKHYDQFDYVKWFNSNRD